jgi:phosphate transport system permease protein
MSGAINTQTSASYARRRFMRKLKSNFIGLMVLATALALTPLFLVLGYLLSKGASSVNLNFFTRMPTPVGQPGGGMANAIVGTFELVAIAIVMEVPTGIGAGIYIAENPAKWLARAVRFAADIMMGIPSIVMGIFVYAVMVQPAGGFSTLAGAAALAIIMLPLMTRTTDEMILLVPAELREAAMALGVPRWRTILSVVARAAASRIATGIILAIARIAGATAPLLFTAFGKPFLVHRSYPANRLFDYAGLHLCQIAICRLAKAGLGRALVLAGIVLEVGVRWITRGSARIAQ